MVYLPVTLQEDGYLVPCTNIHLFFVYVNTVGDVGRLLFHGQQHIASVVIEAYGWQHKASLNLGQDTKLTTQPTFSFWQNTLINSLIQHFFIQVAVMSIKFSNI